MTTTPKAQRRGLLSRLNLFGGTPAKKWEAENVVPASDITQNLSVMYGSGMTTVASLMSSGKRGARSRDQIYSDWAQMESDPIVSTSIGLLVTSALGGHETSGELVFIEKKASIEKDSKLANMVNEIASDLSGMFNDHAFQMSYLAGIFGDSYARIFAKPKDGVIGMMVDELIRPPLVQPYERGPRTVGYSVSVGERNFEPMTALQMVRMKMPRTQWVPQFGVIEKSLKQSLREDDMDKLPLLPSMVGGSLIYAAEEPYQNLSASLLGLVGQRWLDSIDEQIMTLNMNDMSKDKQEKFASSITRMLQRSKDIAEQAVKGGKPIFEKIRHIVPVNGDKQLTALQGLGQQPGRTGTIGIEDVMLHARLTSGAIGVDLSMVGFADQLSGGLGDGGFFRTSAQAAERARILRVSLAQCFNNVIDIHTMHRYGVVFKPSDRPWNINFFGSISALEAEKQRTRMDAMGVGMTLAQTMQQLKDMGATKELMESFLTTTMMLDKEQAVLYAKIVDAKPAGGGDEFV